LVGWLVCLKKIPAISFRIGEWNSKGETRFLQVNLKTDAARFAYLQKLFSQTDRNHVPEECTFQH
jgi:hypothetical protein